MDITAGIQIVMVWGFVTNFTCIHAVAWWDALSARAEGALLATANSLISTSNTERSLHILIVLLVTLWTKRNTIKALSRILDSLMSRVTPLVWLGPGDFCYTRKVKKL